MQAAPETHTLKLWPAYFQAKLEGRKPWEDRSTADRFFREGDTVIFREWDPQAEIYTGRVIGPERITYCLHQPQHEAEARAELLDLIRADNALDSTSASEWGPCPYVCWCPWTPDEITMDGGFTLAELEAIAWWVANRREPQA